jgi:tRNA(fMet)-specific endonuclease VapC
MNLCLDTNAYSSFMAGNDALRELLESAESIIIPVTVLGELYAGFELGTRCIENRTSLDAFNGTSGVKIVSPGREVADRYGLLVKELRLLGKPIPTNDIWIAATALEFGARLVSYDSHFNVVSGLIVLAP